MPRIRKLFGSASSLSVFLAMEEILAVALGRKLAKLRESGLSSSAAFARIEELERRLLLCQRWLTLYISHFERTGRIRRFEWSGEARVEILRLKAAERLSATETARRSNVDPSTVYRWEGVLRADPTATRIGSLMKPVPPIRRIADGVRRVVKELDGLNLLGARSLAHHVARAAIRISPTTVRRIRREPIAPKTPAPSPPSVTGSSRRKHVDRPIRARRPRHIYMLDLTSVGGWLRIFDFKIAMVLDAYSRFPVAAQVFVKEPSAVEIRELLRRAFDRHGPPDILVTDHGSAFTATRLRSFLRRRNVAHRLGAVGHSGSIAIIERSWRTLKALLCGQSLRTARRLLPFRPLVAVDLRRRLEVVLTYYATHRPHQGLHGATPAEVFFQQPPASLAARPAARGLSGQESTALPVAIRFADDAETLPYLARAA